MPSLVSTAHIGLYARTENQEQGERNSAVLAGNLSVTRHPNACVPMPFSNPLSS